MTEDADMLKIMRRILKKRGKTKMKRRAEE